MCKYKTQWRFPICIAIHVAVSCRLKITFAANVEHDRRGDHQQQVAPVHICVHLDMFLTGLKHLNPSTEMSTKGDKVN